MKKPTLIDVLEFDLRSRERRVARAIRDIRQIMDAAQRELERGPMGAGGTVATIPGLAHYAAEFECAAGELSAMREALKMAKDCQ